MKSMGIYLVRQFSRNCNGRLRERIGQDRTGQEERHLRAGRPDFSLLVYFLSYDVHSVLSFFILYIEYLICSLSPWSFFSFPV